MNRIRHYGYDKAYKMGGGDWEVGLEIVEQVKEPDVVGRKQIIRFTFRSLVKDSWKWWEDP